MLLWGGYDIRFHTAIPQIPDKAADAQLFRSVLREVTKAHALDHPGDEISLGYFCVAHESSKL